MDRVAVIVRLRPGCEERARALVSGGPPFDPAETGFDGHAVYVGGGEVVFVFEGPGVEWMLRDLVDDRVQTAAFAAWGNLIDGAPRVAYETYNWRATAPTT
jgi:hypothetical protein